MKAFLIRLFAAQKALARVLVLEHKYAEYAERLATVEQRLDQNERSVTVIQTTLEEWRGE